MQWGSNKPGFSWRVIQNLLCSRTLQCSTGRFDLVGAGKSQGCGQGNSKNDSAGQDHCTSWPVHLSTIEGLDWPESTHHWLSIMELELREGLKLVGQKINTHVRGPTSLATQRQNIEQKHFHPNLIEAQRNGILKYSPNHRLGAAWGGQRAVIAVVGGQIMFRWDQLCQGDALQRCVVIWREKSHRWNFSNNIHTSCSHVFCYLYSTSVPTCICEVLQSIDDGVVLSVSTIWWLKMKIKTFNFHF